MDSFIGSLSVTTASVRRRPLAVRGARKFRSCRKSRAGFSGSRVVPGLKHLAKAFRISLRPAARQRCIIVDKNIGAIGHGLSVIQSVDKDENFAILVTLWIQVLLIFSAELPIVEQTSAMAVRGAVRFKPCR